MSDASVSKMFLLKVFLWKLFAYYIPQPVQLHSPGRHFHHTKGEAISETLLGKQ